MHLTDGVKIINMVNIGLMLLEAEIENLLLPKSSDGV